MRLCNTLYTILKEEQKVNLYHVLNGKQNILIKEYDIFDQYKLNRSI